jgi:hypothetical protein
MTTNAPIPLRRRTVMDVIRQGGANGWSDEQIGAELQRLIPDSLIASWLVCRAVATTGPSPRLRLVGNE